MKQKHVKNGFNPFQSIEKQTDLKAMLFYVSYILSSYG